MQSMSWGDAPGCFDTAPLALNTYGMRWGAFIEWRAHLLALELRFLFCSLISSPPAWRNWQTRWTQNPVIARSCGFDPLRRHSLAPKPLPKKLSLGLMCRV